MSSPLKSVSNGRFQIYDPIGVGGVATVYKAYDRSANEMCALKLMNDDSIDNEKRRARFLSEAETLESLEHPNIVPVRAVGETRGRLWIAMDLMNGGSAARALKVRGPLPAADALDIAYKVLLGLERAHEAGVIHRDVKPQNILLGDDDAVKLCDFGIARQEKPKEDAEVTAEGLTQMFDRLGSIIYMAPEQRADPRDVGPRTDIYAVGASLFALLTGRRPPDLSRAAIRPKMLEPVAAPLRPLILRATALDRTQRFATATEMAAEVLRLRDDARLKPEWYARPVQDRRAARQSQQDFAQWPERPSSMEAAGMTPTPAPTAGPPSSDDPLPPSPPETPPPAQQRAPSSQPLPSHLQRRESYRPGQVSPSNQGQTRPKASRAPARAAVAAPAPRPSLGETLSTVPTWAWMVLAAAIAGVLFVGGLGGGILLVRALAQ